MAFCISALSLEMPEDAITRALEKDYLSRDPNPSRRAAYIKRTLSNARTWAKLEATICATSSRQEAASVNGPTAASHPDSRVIINSFRRLFVGCGSKCGNPRRCASNLLDEQRHFSFYNVRPVELNIVPAALSNDSTASRR